MSEWTDAHRMEALRRTYELAAELAALSTEQGRIEGLLGGAHVIAADGIDRWAEDLRDAGFDVARVDREVRRVDGLATGRLVREPTERYEVRHHGRTDQWTSWSEALDAARIGNIERPGEYRAIRVRTTRIRRAA